jgi:hypothetical protein
MIELGFGIPQWLRLVPVDFEAGASISRSVIQVVARIRQITRSIGSPAFASW